MNQLIRKRCIQISQGLERPDLVIKNARVINVFTKEITLQHVLIADGYIVSCCDAIAQEMIECDTVIDIKGKYLLPGFIDAHVHIESTMASPAVFAQNIIPFGTTTIIADPHEIANVCGMEGIRYMIEASKNLPVSIYYMMPSCVPALPFENNGGAITATHMNELLDNPHILGLGEVMDFPSVLRAEDEMMDKLDLFQHKIIDGHTNHMTPKQLTSYRLGGITTNHECNTVESAIEHLRLGMYLQIREGSAARNLTALITGLLERNMSFNRCMMCTDDKHITDIKAQGHISYNVKRAIELGVDPITAIQMATINTANCYRLWDIGAIAPTYQADMIVIDNFDDFNIEMVFKAGKQHMGYEAEVSEIEKQAYPNIYNTLHIKPFQKQQLELAVKKRKQVVIQLVPHDITTKKVYTDEIRVVDGIFSPDERFSKAVVVERHKATGNIGVGIIEGFGITGGAIGSSIGHDSHNIIVIGDNDDDIYCVIKQLGAMQGGLAIASHGAIVDRLAFPIAGLMTDQPDEFLQEKLSGLLERAYQMGVKSEFDPFMTMAFLSLPVIGEIRITDQGIWDLETFSFLR